MNYLTSTVNEYRGDAVEGADGFFLPHPRRLKCLAICTESDLSEDENKLLLISITDKFAEKN